MQQAAADREYRPSRPRYRSEQDKRAEVEIAAAIEQSCGFKLQELSDWAYRLDYAATVDGWHTPVLGFIEVKHRNLPLLKNSGVPVAWHKVTWARFMVDGTDCFAWFVIRCAGGEIIKTDLLRPQSKLILSGRRDRGTPGDIEPMAVFPWAQWTYLDGKSVIEGS